MLQLKLRTPAFAMLLGVLTPDHSGSAAPSAHLEYCNAVQNKVGFIRYPLGTIGVWSTASGESADVLTRVPRIYPCVNAAVARPPKEEWRASVTGDPSMLLINYESSKPCGPTTMVTTVSPHVSVFKVSFPETAARRYLVFDFTKPTVDSWARLDKWNDRTVTRVDDRTLHAVIGEPGQRSAYYMIRFSERSVASGGCEAAATGAVKAVDASLCRYAQFDAPSVTVAVAVSFTSLEQAGQFLAAEFTDFDAVHRRCRLAWEEVLTRVAVEGSDTVKRMAATALYTTYANIIDGSDGSCYAKYYPRPRSVASSAYWQFIGGYQSCCWDNVRATYPFLMLAYPEVMTDVLNTYLARYERDGCLDGDICLFTGTLGHRNIRFSPLLVAQAFESSVPAPYAKLYAALKDNFSNPAFAPESLVSAGYLLQATNGGFACSRSLEYATGFDALALLARAHSDSAAAARYARSRQLYTNLWDSAARAFRVKDSTGAWGPIENQKMTWNPNPQGLFEGSTRDWMFAVPHDPYGLMALPGQQDFARRVAAYCLNDAWFNDYQLQYPLLLYYAGAPNTAQQIIRQRWVPLFDQAVMFEGVRPKPPHGGWQTHYTGNSGWLLCSLIGLYPVPAPAGQFIITSPPITEAVIRNGRHDLTIRTKNNNHTNIYIRSITVDGRGYPAYLIPAKRLAAGATIELEMGSDSSQSLGDLYVGSSDGFILDAELRSASVLRCTVECGAVEATTKIHTRNKPVKVLLDDQPVEGWGYDDEQQTLAIRTFGTARIEVVTR
ncbi:MAG TPA: glycoside hydrolase domain-containing protein [Verrucomicrobiae bacterium]